MKRLISAFALSLAAIAQIFGQPQAKWLETDHNFGAFGETTGHARTEFRYVNTGNEPLVIVNARTTCGCTLPEYSRAPLAPGDTASITVDFDPTGRLGRFEKQVVVDMNSEPRRTRLTIRGVVVASEASLAALYPEMRGPVALQRSTVLTGEVPKGKLKTMFVNVYNRSSDTIAPAIGPTPDFLHISLEPKRLPPGEQGSFIIYFHSDKCPLWGPVSSQVEITPAAGAEPFTLEVAGSVVEDFPRLSDKDIAKAPVATLTPADRILLMPSAKDHATLEATAEIRNTGRSPLKIRRIYSDSEAVAASLDGKDTLKPGKSARIHISAPAAAVPADGTPLNSQIIIITNSPSSPRTSLRVLAQ